MRSTPRKFSIGRDPRCDLPLGDESVSARHAELTCLDDGRLLLTDCKSTNGTFLLDHDGSPHPIRQQLVVPADRVRFGAVTLGVGDLLEALRSRGVIDAARTPSAASDAPSPLHARQLIRCLCGAIKPRSAPCPECGQ